MAGIQDFIHAATSKLGLDAEAATAGVGGLLGLIKEHVGAVDFGKVAAAIPGADAAVKAAPSPGGGAGGGGGLGGLLGGLAAKAEGLLGGSGGAAAALSRLAGSGLDAGKAKDFLQMFVRFLKDKLPADLLKTLAAKVPGLGSLLG